MTPNASRVRCQTRRTRSVRRCEPRPKGGSFAVVAGGRIWGREGDAEGCRDGSRCAVRPMRSCAVPRRLRPHLDNNSNSNHVFEVDRRCGLLHKKAATQRSHRWRELGFAALRRSGGSCSLARMSGASAPAAAHPRGREGTVVPALSFVARLGGRDAFLWVVRVSMLRSADTTKRTTSFSRGGARTVRVRLERRDELGPRSLGRAWCRRRWCRWRHVQRSRSP